MMATIQKHACPMCGSSNRETVEVTYKSGKTQSVPVCQTCCHYDFPDTEYGYVIRGIGHNWSSMEDLRRTLEAILKDSLPPEDVQKLKVEVAELG